MSQDRPLHRRAATPGVALLLLLAGCGGPATAPVSGTVWYNDEPLSNGTVAFLADDGRGVSAMIQEDGTYTIPQAPVGPVKATVQTFPPSPSVVPPGTPARSVPRPGLRYVAIPEHYRDMNRSGLKYVVAPGRQTIDIRLRAVAPPRKNQ
jgi:hypothetical protein